jgi:hypothetical protein
MYEVDFFERVTTMLEHQKTIDYYRNLIPKDGFTPCGKWVVRMGDNLDMHKTHYVCRDWRNCDNCRAERTRHQALYLNNLRIASESDDMHHMFFPDTDEGKKEFRESKQKSSW